MSYLTILIVEDDEEIGALLRVALGKLGKIIVCACPQAALSARFHAQADIIIIDDLMPILSGYEYSQEVIADTGGKHPPMILLASAPTYGIATNQFAHICQKPFLPKHITSLVTALAAVTN